MHEIFFYNKFIKSLYMFEQYVLEHVEARNKLIIKEDLCIKLVNY